MDKLRTGSMWVTLAATLLVMVGCSSGSAQGDAGASSSGQDFTGKDVRYEEVVFTLPVVETKTDAIQDGEVIVQVAGAPGLAKMKIGTSSDGTSVQATESIVQSGTAERRLLGTGLSLLADPSQTDVVVKRDDSNPFGFAGDGNRPELTADEPRVYLFAMFPGGFNKSRELQTQVFFPDGTKVDGVPGTLGKGEFQIMDDWPLTFVQSKAPSISQWPTGKVVFAVTMDGKPAGYDAVTFGSQP